VESDSQEATGGLDDETIAFAQRVFHAARTGDADHLDGLLQAGLPPNLRNDKGDSLLMLASYHGHLDAARRLLAHAADPELANDRGQTPLAAAAYQGDIAMVRLLIDGGAQVNGSGHTGRSALMTAAMFNRVDIVEVLLANGADPLARDAEGLTAEAAARIMGAPDTPELLARAQAARRASQNEVGDCKLGAGGEMSGAKGALRAWLGPAWGGAECTSNRADRCRRGVDQPIGSPGRCGRIRSSRRMHPPGCVPSLCVSIPGARTAWHTHPLGQTLYVVPAPAGCRAGAARCGTSAPAMWSGFPRREALARRRSGHGDDARRHAGSTGQGFGGMAGACFR
jgi:hypothetical protein